MWKKIDKNIWQHENGMIITNESMTFCGKKIKFFPIYLNQEQRYEGNNFASAESVKEAKMKAEQFMLKVA